MPLALSSTDLKFPVPFTKYSGKVRDVYAVGNELLVIVATDRISAFDVILPDPIPYKGQVLNQTAAYFLNATREQVPNHVVAVPDPNVTIGLRCESIPVEVVVRGYLAGHAWRTYESGKRILCGVTLPEGLKENDPLPQPIITPTTKSTIGHDEDISEGEILKSGLLEEEEWERIRHYALTLFREGTHMAGEQGLILVDTKYEFGYYKDDIILIDEIHTPDSSRYFYSEGYAERQQNGEPQKQLSKEFVRKWLMSNGFMGKEGETVPRMDGEFMREVTERYIELYEKVTGKIFVREDTTHLHERMQESTLKALRELGMKH